MSSAGIKVRTRTEKLLQEEVVHEKKSAMYQKLVDVRCRGFAGCSLFKVLGQLAVTGAAKRRAIQA